MAWGLATGALLALRMCARSLADTPLNCPDQERLMLNLQAMHGVCIDQMKEDVNAGGPQDYFPGSCRSPECARVVRRITAGCAALVSQPFMADYKRRFEVLTAKCDAAVGPPNAPKPTSFPVYAVSSLASSGNGAIEVCDGVLIDRPDTGNGQAGSNWRQEVKVQAPAGQTVEVIVTMMWLGADTQLVFYDGETNSDPVIGKHLKGFARPSGPVRSTGSAMLVQVLWENDAGALTAWSLKLGCSCSNNATCGTHGTCTGDMKCACTDGYAGPSCSDASCRGVECGAGKCGRQCNGSNCTNGECICGPTHTGPTCSEVKGPCSEHKWIELGDNNSWRASREPGNHCDAPDLHDGRKGPFSPLSRGGKSQWYRFTGQAGVGLATSDFQGPDHLGPSCSTGGGGWLSNWSAPFGNPPVSYADPGQYPDAKDGTTKLVTICFNQPYQPCASATRAQVVTCVCMQSLLLCRVLAAIAMLRTAVD